MALAPGSTAGPYRIIEPLGRGGMASVYKAYEAGLDRYVALKVLPREFLHDPSFAERFRREAKVIASLEHPNIIPIYAFDIEQEEGIPWMAMRLIAGGALSGQLKQKPPTLARSVAILRGVADALDYAHDKGIVHRDVKPQNILLDEAGRVYLADFGIAKIVESSAGLTATGMITGTPQYMAPEQATGTKIDRRADIYALGIVAYEMFTGRVPFSADTPVAVLLKHMQDPMPLPSPAEVPEPLVRALLKSTVKKPEDRWGRASDFVAALEDGLGGRVSRVDTTAPTRDLPRVAGPGSAAPALAAPERTAVPAPTAVPPPTLAPTTAVRPPNVVPAATAPPAVVSEVAPPPAAPRVSRPSIPRPPASRGLSMATVVLVGSAGIALVAGAGLVVWRRSRPAEPAGPSLVATEPTPVPTTAPSTAAVTMSATPTAPPVAVSDLPSPSAPPPGPRVPPTAAATAAPAVRPSAIPTAAAPTPVPRPPEPVRPPEPRVSPVVQELMSGLAASESGTRWRAAEGLGNLGGEALPAVAALTNALRDRSPEVRWRAAEALGKIGPEARGAVAGLAAAARDSDVLVRSEAAKALGLLGGAAAEAVDVLAAGLRDPEVGFRREAAKALARIGAEARTAVSALVGALKDKDKFVRSESAKALGRIGPDAREAVPALTAAARDPELVVSREAALALQKIGGS